MKISEDFVSDILTKTFPASGQQIYDGSPLLQYLDKKMKAVHGNCKTRRSLANIYAIYSLLHFYQNDFYQDRAGYREFQGYDYTKLLNFCRQLYGGAKLQNHALNTRVNGEFSNKFPDHTNPLIIVNNGRYLLHIDYLYVHETDISKTASLMIERYIQLLIRKDHELLHTLKIIEQSCDYQEKRKQLISLLNEDAEARIFEIISYAILKTHYKNMKAYFGYSRENICEEELHLYKTGRTNANDGGIDFVMRPAGRFFQVTEVSNYDKYLLDLDKVMHFPVTFVVKTRSSRAAVSAELNDFILMKSGGMRVMKERYLSAVEEIITINELVEWTNELAAEDLDAIIRDIDLFYRLEMNMESSDEE